MFKVGDVVVYPSHGPARITEIRPVQIGGADQLCYILETDVNAGVRPVVILPVDKIESSRLRKIIDESEVPRVLDILKDRTARSRSQTWNRRHREYQEKMRTGSIFKAAEVFRDLCLLKQDRDLLHGERRLLDQAKNLLVRELAASKKAHQEGIERLLERIFSENSGQEATSVGDRVSSDERSPAERPAVSLVVSNGGTLAPEVGIVGREERLRNRSVGPEQDESTPYDVFISSAPNDAETAENLAQALGSAGLKVWIDRLELRPGESWRQRLRDELDNSRVCLVLLSETALSSKPWASVEWPLIQDSIWRREDFAVLPIELGPVDTPPFLSRWEALTLDRENPDIEALKQRIMEILAGDTLNKVPISEEADRLERADRFSEIWQQLVEEMQNPQSDEDEVPYAHL
ncbi:MAG: TIR domain-containing protein [Thermodesulfobacteriota bacterium]